MSTRMKVMKMLMKSSTKPKPQLREAAKKKRWNILRGDTVQVIGNIPEKGKQGIVKEVIRKQDRVTVEGVNIGSRRIKGDPDRGIKGKTIRTERSIHYSNVNLVDPVTGLPTRVYRKFLEDGTKVRVSKRSGAIIPRPEILSMKRRPNLNPIVTESDTLDEDVWSITYVQPSPPKVVTDVNA